MTFIINAILSLTMIPINTTITRHHHQYHEHMTINCHRPTTISNTTIVFSVITITITGGIDKLESAL